MLMSKLPICESYYMNEKIDFTTQSVQQNNRVATKLVHNGRTTDLFKMLCGLAYAIADNDGMPVTLEQARVNAPKTRGRANPKNGMLYYGKSKEAMRGIHPSANSRSLMYNLIKMGYAEEVELTTARGGSLFDITPEGEAALDDVVKTLNFTAVDDTDRNAGFDQYADF